MAERGNLPSDFVFSVSNLQAKQTAPPKVTLEVLNPRGEIPVPQPVGIRPRVDSLAGKRIGLCDNGKFGAHHFLEALEALLKESYPTASILRLPKPPAQTITLADGWYPEVAAQVDTFVFATGD